MSVFKAGTTVLPNPPLSNGLYIRDTYHAMHYSTLASHYIQHGSFYAGFKSYYSCVTRLQYTDDIFNFVVDSY